VLATLVAWWRRLGEEPGGAPWRWAKLFVLYLGVSIGLTSHFFVLHELWTGTLLALAFGLHRPGRWGLALAVAALALAIREHALPFILLMAAMAFWRRDWKEGGAWTALAAAFLVALAVHLQLVSAHTLPTDPASPGWLELRGLSGWLSNIVLASNLRFLPHWVAGPLVIVLTLCWAGRRRAGPGLARRARRAGQRRPSAVPRLRARPRDRGPAGGLLLGLRERADDGCRLRVRAARHRVAVPLCGTGSENLTICGAKSLAP